MGVGKFLEFLHVPVKEWRTNGCLTYSASKIVMHDFFLMIWICS